MASISIEGQRVTVTFDLPAPDKCAKSESGKSYQTVTVSESVSLPKQYGTRPMRLNVNGFVTIPEANRKTAPATLGESVGNITVRPATATDAATK